MNTHSDRYRTVTHLMLGTILGAALTLGSAIAGTQADAAQPYGGCDEAWQAPQSEGADWCRDRGWTVRKRIVVGPKGWVRYSTLPSCSTEDASSGPVPCSWNFGTSDGDGKGNAYWVTGTNKSPVFHYVKGVK